MENNNEIERFCPGVVKMDNEMGWIFQPGNVPFILQPLIQ